MEYQEMINLLDITPNHPVNSRTKNWDEINDDSLESLSPMMKLDLKLQC